MWLWQPLLLPVGVLSFVVVSAQESVWLLLPPQVVLLLLLLLPVGVPSSVVGSAQEFEPLLPPLVVRLLLLLLLPVGVPSSVVVSAQVVGVVELLFAVSPVEQRFVLFVVLDGVVAPEHLSLSPVTVVVVLSVFVGPSFSAVVVCV